ncbi:PH domain-containing protein [Amycolatopsis acidicola]|uniref:PH domain-containing protein n=1 Tax=Amycolatopsis acidicola TaxID=2596893 RepID=UPI00140BF0C7|nr:PH domain-containing protein [Amycolatopsis acidicola]
MFLALTVRAATLGDAIGFGLCCGLVAWGAWSIGIQARIVVGEDRIVVVDWFFRHEIPYGAVESVDRTGGGVCLVLRTGRKVTPVVSGSSAVSALMGDLLQNRILAAVQAAMAAQTAGPAEPKRSFQPHLLALLLFVGSLVALAAARYLLPR